MVDMQDWIPVGTLGEAFAPQANLLPRASGLLGKRLTLHLQNGWLIELRFTAAATLGWQIRDAKSGGTLEGDAGAIAYSVTEIRQGVFFVDFIDPQQRASTASFVLDMSRKVCTAVFGQLPTAEEARQPFLERIAEGKELTSVGATFLHGAIDAPFTAATETHAETTELVGKRVEYTYSPTERYEHVYLNEKFYSWHCLAGSERGLADTDRCHYFRIAPLLYLFVWREKIVPTLGVVVVDLEQMKTTGKILGYRGFDCGAVTNFPIGARARVLSGA